MRFAELAEYLPRIEAELSHEYRKERARAGPTFRRYVDALSEFTLRGGKRFRALLVLAGFHLATGRSPAPAVSAAAAFEHFQTWMLVHDDIIDHSETRRGGPTLHRLMEAEFRGRAGVGRAEEYGMGVGITLGDLEEPFTVGALLDAPVAADRRLEALREYVRMTRETAFGQALDIRNGSLPVDQVREADVLSVHRNKTAVYTVASPLRIGAMLGGAKAPLLEDLDAIGIDYGIAFQLRDDILGTGFGSEASGKSANDLIEGKRTLLVVRAWSGSDPSGQSTLSTALGNPSATSGELDLARETIRRSGSLDYSERKIRALAERADRRVDRSRNLRPAGQALLREIGDRLVHRSA